jgi:signal transduction histidine kinase
VIRPVAAPPAVEPDAPINLAAVGRAALGADAVLLAATSASSRLELLCSDGLSGAEEESVLGTISHRPRGVRAEVEGFEQALIREVSLPGIGDVRICALQRRRAAFESPDMALAIAQHAAIATGLRRHGSPEPTAEPAVDTYELIERALDWGGLDRAVTQQVRRLVPAQRTGLFLWREDEQSLCPVSGAFGLDPSLGLPAVAAADWGASAARVFATGEPYLTNQAGEDPGAASDYRDAFVIRRLIAVPIEASGRRIGVLQAVNKDSAFTLADLEQLARVAPAVAWAAEVVALRERVRRSERLELLFTSTAVEVASGRGAQDHLESGLDELRVALGGSVVALVVGDAEVVVYRSRRESAALERRFLAQAREATGFREFDAPPRRAGQPGWSATHAPVVVDGAELATLSILRVGGGRLGPAECQALSRMAQLIALGWATESYQRGLADAARSAERRRIADELHDHVAQLLFAARLSLDVGAEAIPDPAAGISRARDLLVRADEATRMIMDRNSGSEPSRVSGLLAGVITEIEDEYGRAVGLEVATVADDAADDLGQAGRQMIARAAREALVNAAKHAGPCQISVRLRRQHPLCRRLRHRGVAPCAPPPGWNAPDRPRVCGRRYASRGQPAGVSLAVLVGSRPQVDDQTIV